MCILGRHPDLALTEGGYGDTALIHYATWAVSLGIKQLKPALQLIVSCLITRTTVRVQIVMFCIVTLRSLVGDSNIPQGLTVTIIRVEPNLW